MQTKLTLRMDSELIERAKEYAREREISVSQLVADYFSILQSEGGVEAARVTPIVDALRGALREVEVQDGDHRRWARERHL